MRRDGLGRGMSWHVHHGTDCLEQLKQLPDRDLVYFERTPRRYIAVVTPE